MRNDPPSAEVLRALALAQEYPFPERAPKWAERLALHLPDLTALRGLPVSAEPVTLPERAFARGPVPLPTPAPLAGLPAGASAATLAAAVRARQVSALEVARAHLERLEANRHLNAFISVAPERVLAEASAVDARIARGEAVGELAGVPVAVKDLLQVAGYPYTCGTKALPGAPATVDAQAVACLRAAGAVILGTTNLHELAYGVTSANIHFGAVVNPAFPAHIPGGSSGGSAAAVAAGIAPLALGSDTGGSIRIPAACCGIVGFKPSYDAVSRDGVAPLAWSLDHIGPLSGCVADAALCFAALTGVGVSQSAPTLNGAQRLLRPAGYLTEVLDPHTRYCFEASLQRLAQDGFLVEEAVIPGMEQVPLAQFPTLCAEASQANWQLLLEHPEAMAQDVRLRLEVGQFISAVDYIKAQRLRRTLGATLSALLGEGRLLVLPTLPVPVPHVGVAALEVQGRSLLLVPAMTRLTSPFNALGLPALSIPVRSVDAGDGPPFSLQIVGPHGADLRVLALGQRLEHLLAAAA